MAKHIEAANKSQFIHSARWIDMTFAEEIPCDLLTGDKRIQLVCQGLYPLCGVILGNVKIDLFSISLRF
jgi:ABC-type iron transport system FetAB permease component